jgi:hypothetical protein
MTETVQEGGCSCREVRYRMHGTPLIVHACHCRECQRLTGSAFALNALIETERVERLSGVLRKVPVIGASGKPQTIFRCAGCSVALWSHYAGGGDKLCFLRVGTLDEPERQPPDVHIYTVTKLPWLKLPDAVPAFPEYYSARSVWRPESLERRAGLFGG